MRSRKAIASTSAFLFGLSATILFVALWGRAVVVDTETLGESLAPMSQSAVVVDQVTEWLTGELVESGVDPIGAESAVAEFRDSSAMSRVLGVLVIDVVEAAAHPGESTLDVAGPLLPAVPDIVGALSEVGVNATEGQVEAVVSNLDPIVIIEPASAPLVGPESQIESRLTTAAVLAVMVMGVAAWVAVAASPDRLAEIRRLLTRVALGGLTFALLLRFGSWLLDPAGGRAPISSTLSALAGSKWMVPLSIGLVAAAAAGVAALAWLGLRPKEDFPVPSEDPIQQEELLLSR